MRHLPILRQIALSSALAAAICAPSSGAENPAPAASADETSSTHFQATLIPQGHGPITAPYTGPNSLYPTFEGRTSLTSTLFQGYRVWKTGEFYVNPELSAGSGISQTHGIAGFPNGEIYRVDDPNPKLNLSRLYLRQVFGLGGETERIEPDKNQLGETLDISRLSFILGKFALNDFFDNNAYSHDPRTQFFNWALMDTAAWDYAADTRGYTWGLIIELNQKNWAVRAAYAQVPTEANGMEFDEHLTEAFGLNLEGEVRYALGIHPGRARLLAWLNRARMGNYEESIQLSPTSPDITATRSYSDKYGYSLNLEQEITPDWGFFLRAGWDDGLTETWVFTEVDRSLSTGVSVKGTQWKRENDTFGLALILDGLSPEHANYLAAGGLGFLLGDGALDYAPEQIVETYYSLQLLTSGFYVSPDFQYVKNPGYNADRGPATIFGVRLHYEF